MTERKSDPVRFENDKWGFWDETWSHWEGGYATEEEARRALANYCREVLGL